MNKSVNPWVAALILIFFGSLIVAYVWASNHWIALNRLGLAKITNENQFAVQFGNRIEVVGPNGNRSNIINLAELNEKKFIGDFAFFSNGDVLLSLKHSSEKFSENIKILNREKNTVVNSEDSLYRCNSEFTSCNVFSPHLPPMNRTFRLFIDNSDKVYIADTSRHKLWLLDANGNLLAFKEGFLFPNQIAMVDGELWVADTNHHAIKRITSDPNRFGEPIQTISTELSPTRHPMMPKIIAKYVTKKHVWPVGFYINSTEIWALVCGENLAYCRVALFDRQGEFKRELLLPEGADLVSITGQNSVIQVVDLAQYRIYQFTQQGERINDLLLTDLQYDLEQEKQKSDYYLKWEKLIVYLFVIGLVVGLSVAILLSFYSGSEEEEHLVGEKIKNKAVAVDICIEPCESYRKKTKSLFLLFLVAPALTALLFYNMDFSSGAIFTVMIIMLVIFLVMAIIWRLVKKLLSQRLNIYEDKVVLYRFDKNIEVKYEDIYWTNSSLLIGRHFVPIGSATHNVIFSYDELVKNLLPRLRQENKLSHITMFIYYLRSDKKQLIPLILVVVLLLIKSSLLKV